MVNSNGGECYDNFKLGESFPFAKKRLCPILEGGQTSTSGCSQSWDIIFSNRGQEVAKGVCVEGGGGGGGGGEEKRGKREGEIIREKEEREN